MVLDPEDEKMRSDRRDGGLGPPKSCWPWYCKGYIVDGLVSTRNLTGTVLERGRNEVLCVDPQGSSFARNLETRTEID